MKTAKAAQSSDTQTFSGGVLNPFEFESSTLTIVLQQIITLKTTKSKFYVATPCVTWISALGMASLIMMKVPYQPRVRIPVWASLETDLYCP